MNHPLPDILPAPWDEDPPQSFFPKTVPPVFPSGLLNPSPPPEKSFNYIPYFSEVEKVFAAERGKPCWLSTTAWGQVETWKSEGIPCEVVCDGIRLAFATIRKRAGKSASKEQIYGIGYCDPFVRAMWKRWKKRQGMDVPSPAPTPGAPTDQPSLPLEPSPPAVPSPAPPPDTPPATDPQVARLRSLADQLAVSRPPGRDWSPGDWETMVREAAGRLHELADRLATDTSLGALVRTEALLMELEENLSNCLWEQTPASRREALWESGRTLAVRQGLTSSMRRVWVEQYVRRQLWAEAGWPPMTMMPPTD